MKFHNGGSVTVKCTSATLSGLVENTPYAITVQAMTGDSRTELEIAVGHWPFSDQFASFGRANPIC